MTALCLNQVENFKDSEVLSIRGQLAHMHPKLIDAVLGRVFQRGVVFSINHCPHCGNGTFCDLEPILCPHYLLS